MDELKQALAELESIESSAAAAIAAKWEKVQSAAAKAGLTPGRIITTSKPVAPDRPVIAYGMDRGGKVVRKPLEHI